MYISEEELQSISPVKGEVLDEYLSKGFYRIRQYLFTTFFIDYEGSLHDVFWLRTKIKSVQLSASAKRINRINASFQLKVKPFVLTNEMEELFQLYRNHVKFSHSNNLRENLLGDADTNIFDSKMIEIRDGKKLIAFGIFDEGAKSIMGIINVYHPQYHKYSLGKYLILQKLAYCAQHNLDYYYTGYIAIGLTHFDYKTYPDEHAVEALLFEPYTWVPFANLGKEKLSAFGLLNQFELIKIDPNNSPDEFERDNN